MTETNAGSDAPAEIRCAECGTTLSEGQDRETTDDATFCRPCFNNLTAHLQQIVAEQSSGINYPMAFVGGVGGAALGSLVWWGFTVVTNIAFGLVAIVIGFAVGHGVAYFSGGKRGAGLQAMSAAIGVVGFFYASYLVNRTFIMQALAEQGQEAILPWLPGPELFVRVIQAGFGVMDLVFLAIVVWEAWKIPAPITIDD